MTRSTFWWNCKHMISPLGVAYCKKYDKFCLKSNCEEITDRKGEIKKELESVEF